METRRSTRASTRQTVAEEPAPAPKKRAKTATARATAVIETPEQAAKRVKYESDLPELKEKLLKNTFNYFKKLLLKPSENINNLNEIEHIYYQVWFNYIGSRLSYQINRYLREMMDGSFEIDNAKGDRELLNDVFIEVVPLLVDYNSIIPGQTEDSEIKIVAKALKDKGCSGVDGCKFDAEDLIFEIKRKVNKMLETMSTAERLSALINLADQSFSFRGDFDRGQKLTRPTSKNELFYRGIANFSPEAYIIELSNNPTNIAYLSTSMDEKIAAWHAKMNTEEQGGDPSNKFVVKYVCDPEIRVIDTTLVIHKPVQSSEKECVFPRGCHLTYVGTEVLEQYSTQEPLQEELAAHQNYTGIEVVNAPLTVITVHVSGPTATAPAPVVDVGGRKRKSRRRRSSRKRRSTRRR